MGSVSIGCGLVGSGGAVLAGAGVAGAGVTGAGAAGLVMVGISTVGASMMGAAGSGISGICSRSMVPGALGLATGSGTGWPASAMRNWSGQRWRRVVPVSRQKL